MTRKRVLALALVPLAIIGIGLAIVHASLRRAAPVPVAFARTGPSAEVPMARESSATRATIGVNPERSASAWIARSDQVALAKNGRLLNPAVARLFALPPAEAWAALTARARDGDGAGATAALLLATECANLPQQVSSMSAGRAHSTDRLASGLPRDWAFFLRAIDAEWRDRLDARVASCANVGGVRDFALLALDRFMRPDDPATQLAAAEDIADDTTAIADLRQLADQADSEEAHRALGERLMRSASGADQAEGRALLERLATDDTNIVAFLAACFSDGCGRFRGDPEVADAWIEDAAGLGEWWAFDKRIAELKAVVQTSDAWAWALYRLDLALAGCFETNQPQTMWIAQAAQAAFGLEPSLSVDQQAAARAAEHAIAARWKAQATARLGCSG